MADSSVKVAVRVRPFNKKEEAEGAVLCVEMQGNMTRIFSREQKIEKTFFFDYSYWSHDGFTVEQGVSVAVSPKYADQQIVFNDMGIGVLNNAWEGYHTCLFAYGQTGSGKSYSMVGYGPNKGIIPMACDQIFQRIQQSDNPSVQFSVQVAIIEIYNEQIQDLLQPISKRVQSGLKIRESKEKGVYIEGVTWKDVKSYEQITEQLDIGNQNRTVAATQMNASSSRAHTVLTINFSQIFYDQNTGQPLNRKNSTINLVDLAGSERASKTGAQGARLQEGSNINRSLSCLGKVITALAKRAEGRNRNDIIPYRESKLTRILQNALGGNSKTAMIAAISPASSNIDETLSTLRYADAVKSIKNQAIVNETPQEKLIRELKEENERLKALLEGRSIPEEGAQLIDEEQKLEYERQIQELLQLKEAAEMTLQQRLTKEEPSQEEEKKEERQNGPHLSNLNEDPLLSGYIKHFIQEGETFIGKRTNEENQIIVEGLGIGVKHCQIIRNGDQIVIIPHEGCKTMINGKLLNGSYELQNLDRIRFGNHNYFLVIKEPTDQAFDWEFAVKEANEEEVRGFLGQQEEELRKKEEEMKQKLQAEWESNMKMLEDEKNKVKEQMNQQQRLDSRQRRALVDKEQDLIEKQHQLEIQMKLKQEEINKTEANRRALERLRKELTNAIQQVNEANERAIVLGKDVHFRPELYRDPQSTGDGIQSTKVRVKVIYPGASDDIRISWSTNKLEERLIDIQEICNQLSLGVEPEKIDIGYDPFGGDDLDTLPETVRRIGVAYIYLDTIYHLVSFEQESITIIDDKGNEAGKLLGSLHIIYNGENLDNYETIKSLYGKELQLKVEIHQVFSLPDKFQTNVFCNYQLTIVSNETFKTVQSNQTSPDHVFNYSQVHNLVVNSEIVENLLFKALAINVFGDLTEWDKQQEFTKIRQEARTSINPDMKEFSSWMKKDPSQNILSPKSIIDQKNFGETVLKYESNHSIEQINDNVVEQINFENIEQLNSGESQKTSAKSVVSHAIINDRNIKGIIKEKDQRIMQLEMENKEKQEILRKKMEEYDKLKELLDQTKIKANKGSCSCIIL